MRTRDVPCPSPQEKPIEPAFLVPLPSFSEAMRVVTAARWSGSEACRKPSARLTSNTTQRAGDPCKKASSQPSIVAIPSPFLHTTSLLRPATRIRLRRKPGSQTLHFQIVSKANSQEVRNAEFRTTSEQHSKVVRSRVSTIERLRASGIQWGDERRSAHALRDERSG